ncbi:MAG: DUF3285 domain-containing protein [Cyanobacteria bacterium P01_F01_bin.53]
MSTDQSVTTEPKHAAPLQNETPPGFVKLAMRNMVKKGGKSLYHFFLSFVGLMGLFIGLSYLTR